LVASDLSLIDTYDK